LLLELNVPLNRLYPPGGGEQPVVQSFRHPEAPVDFIGLLILLSSLLLVVIATIPAIRRAQDRTFDPLSLPTS
jgi:hypothetical protein